MQDIIKQGCAAYENAQYESNKVILGCFSESCPNCGSKRDEWDFDLPTECEVLNGIKKPAIRECIGFDIVRYRCKCGHIFKKIEESGE